MTYYKAITTIVNLIPILCPDYQELSLISQINKFFNFDHNIFLVDSSVDINCFKNTWKHHPIIPHTLYVYKDESNAPGLAGLTKILGKREFLIVAPERADIESNLKLLTQIKEIQRIHCNIKIGVFFSKSASSTDLQNIFQWFFKNNVINIFVATYSLSHTSTSLKRVLDTFVFNSLGTFQVMNVSGNDSFNKLFLDQNTNFQQFPIRVGLVDPYESLSSDDKLWQIIFEILNASSVAVEGPWSNRKTAFRKDLFVNDTIDILLSTIFAENEPDFADHVIKMYPMQLREFVIAIPEALPFSELSTYLRFATSDLFFCYALITIATILILLTFLRYIKHRKWLFTQSVVDILNLIMNDNQRIRYQQLSRPEAFLIVSLTFAGFIVANGILSILKSFLTRPIIQPQINTIEDIYKSALNVVSEREALAKFLSYDLRDFSKEFSTDDDWEGRVRTLPPEIFYRLVETYDTTNMYFVTKDYAQKIINIQKRLNVRGYHIAKLHIVTIVRTYPVNDNFHFVERLNEIHHRVRSAGLHEKWRREDENDLWINILKKYSSFNDRANVSENMDLLPVPIFIMYGWVAGTITLILEIVWKNCYHQLQRLLKTFFKI